MTVERRGKRLGNILPFLAMVRRSGRLFQETSAIPRE